MFKRSIRFIILTIIISITCMLNTNAQSSIYDTVKPGDVIIGNTVFKNGTWISAARAAKAGALYFNNTMEVDVVQYYLVQSTDTFKLWYRYDINSESYKVMTSSEVEILEEITQIYYNNNEPIISKYTINEIDWIYDFDGKDSFEIEVLYGANVTFDFDTQNDNLLISCPLGSEFRFNIKDLTDDTEREFYGACYNEFYFEELDNEPINHDQIEDVTFSPQLLEDGTEIPNASNVFDVTYESSHTNQHFIDVRVVDELENFNALHNNTFSGPLGRWISFDIYLKDGATALIYKLYTSSNIQYYVDAHAPRNILRVWVNADEIYNNFYNQFIYINEYGNTEYIYVNFSFFDNDRKVSLDTENFVYLHLDENYLVPYYSNYSSYNDLYFDYESKYLYINNNCNAVNLLFADDTSFKILNEVSENVFEYDELIGFVNYGNAYRFLTSEILLDIDVDSLQWAEVFESEKVDIYYFFNRDITNEENNMLNELSLLENVNFINHSSYYYEN